MEARSTVVVIVISFYIEYTRRVSPLTKSPVVQDGTLVRRGGHFAKKGGSIAENERTLRGCASTVGYEQLGPFSPNDKRTTGQLDFVRPLSAVDADKRYKQPNSSSIPTPKLRESPTRPSQEKHIFSLSVGLFFFFFFNRNDNNDDE